jgi:DNA mismatch repair ATPase MutL
LLQPITVAIHAIANIQEKIDEINLLWFDCSLISENTLAIYAIPQIFGIYKVDIEKLFNHILYLDTITYDHVLDKIFASKACKTSIKAWDKLAYPQMVNLIKDWFEHIDWMFVCQHGRPFFVKIEKDSIDKFFDR